MRPSSGAEPLSVVGGIVYPYRRIPLSKGAFSWPFGRLTLSSAGVTLAPRGPLARIARSIEISYHDLLHVERVVPPGPAALHWAEGLRFRCRSPERDRLYFASWPKRIDEIVRALEAAGVEVRGRR
jgi:hypothetical protein